MAFVSLRLVWGCLLFSSRSCFWRGEPSYCASSSFAALSSSSCFVSLSLLAVISNCLNEGWSEGDGLTFSLFPV